MKKLFYTIWAIMILFICSFTTNIRSIKALDEDYYDELCSQIEQQNELDSELINEYEQYVSIVEGKYVLNYPGEDNEDVQFINENIRIINELVDDGEAIISNNEVILKNEEQLSTQFGIKKIASHWYGFDFQLDRDAMKLIGALSLLSRLISGFSLNKLLEKSFNFTNLNKELRNIIKGSSFLGTAGGRLFTAKIVDKYGSVNAFLDTIEVVVSTALIGITSYIALITASTGGVAALVMTAINFVIGLYTPGTIASTIAFVCGATGIGYSSAKMTVRWFKGWGTNLYFNM